MSKKQYDLMMRQYYSVLINAWKDETTKAAKSAIQMLYNMPKDQKLDSNDVLDMDKIIRAKLGDEFASKVAEDLNDLTEKIMKYGFAESDGYSAGYKVTWQFRDQAVANALSKQNVYWVGNHYSSDLSEKFKESITLAYKEGFTKEQLAKVYLEQFRDITKKGMSYFSGLAEHTVHRTKQFGKLSKYERVGAYGYKLLVHDDARTSDICLALKSENKVYPLNEALQIRDDLLAVEMQPDNLQKARDQIKAIAPWVKDDNVIHDSNGVPVGVQGAYTPFPPFHWKCRTTTAMVFREN